MQKPDSLKETQFGGDHYKSMGIEPVQYIEANGINFTLGSAIKYITRHSVKNGAVDLKKAIHFIAMELERVYGVKLTFSFSDEVQLKPDESHEVEVTSEPHDAERLVKAVYPNAKAHPPFESGRNYIWNWDIQPDGVQTGMISGECETKEAAWQSAVERIQKSQATQNSDGEGKA